MPTTEPPVPEGATPRAEYPRPQWRRRRWRSLNGPWRFAADDADRGRAEGWHRTPDPDGPGSPFGDEVIVPFAPHTVASGLADPQPHRVVWYSRRVDVAGLADEDERLLLHIGAADHGTCVWVDGEQVATHSGGYTPVVADVTDVLRQTGTSGTAVVTVRVEDHVEDLEQPRGKQYWRPEPTYVFYTGTTGIWQPVWLEPVPPAHLEGADVLPLLDEAAVEVSVRTSPAAVGGSVRATVTRDGRTVADETFLVTDPSMSRRWRLTEDRGALDAKVLEFQGVATWHPGNPRLYDVTYEVLDAGGRVVDRVESYFGMRTVSTHDGQVLLNGRPLFQRLVLDQGFWPESGYTAPSDDALRADIEHAKSLGFNGARKHQKVEDPRWLYWADRLGFLVWEEMPSAFRYSTRSADALTREWLEVVERDRNHPCIVAWVPINESWGVPAVGTGPDERLRHHLLALYHLTKARDPSRLVVSNDGWEHAVTDLCTIHDYGDADSLATRLADRATAVGSRPLHHPIYADGHAHRGEPIVVSEFGGIALDVDGVWGFHTVEDGHGLVEEYERFVRAVVESPVVAGFCWTQLYDIAQEANGLLDAWRRPKAAPEAIRRVTTRTARIENPTSIPTPEETP